MLSSILRKLSSVLFCLLFANSVYATEIITSDVGSWSGQYPFQTCYAYGGASPCVSDGTYFSSYGIGSGDVIFAYTDRYIYKTFSVPQGFSGDTMYFSLDMMTGPRNENQGNKTEYVIIHIYQKNVMGNVIKQDTIGENITNTTMQTFDYTITRNVYATSIEIRISGRDGGYWAGHYGAVIGAGTITLNDGTSSSAPVAATPVYSSGITSAQSTKRTSKLSDTAAHGMEAHVGITGNSNDVTITQAGDAHYLELGVVGNSNVVDIEQTTVTGGTHYLEANIEGSNNNLDVLQSGTAKTAFIGIDGNSNTANIIQKDSGQHYLQLDMIGDGHTADILQEGSGNHAATVELTNGGGAWDFDLTQSGTTSKEYSLPHSMSDGTTTSGTCYVAAGCSLSVIQND